jgi:hypothetical protein
MKETAQSRWKNLELYRSIYLRRAIDCSSLTIPALVPESDMYNGWQGNTYNKLPSLYQGSGANGVNNLSAKLLLSLYPPAQPFFRLTMDAAGIRDYVEQSGGQEENVSTMFDQVLSKMERQIMRKLDQIQARPAIFEAIKHLLVAGNALLYIGPERIKMFSLRSFCVDRDPEGNVNEIVVKEQVSKKYLPSGVTVEGKVNSQDGSSQELVDVYTHVDIDPDKDRVEWFQEVEGKRIPGSAGFSRQNNSPWLCLRLMSIAGESYGRSLVEETLGDLQSMESLAQAIVEGSLISAKAIGLVNPNGVTRADTLAKAKNGAIVAGNAADVEFLQVQKQNDFATALQAMMQLEKRVQFTFLQNEAIQRNAERVTAEEIRLMAESLDAGLGGTYSLLSAELQLPLIRRIMYLMELQGEFPPIPDGLIEPMVTTGLEAIGRGNDKARLTNFLQTIAAALGPDQFAQYINPTELVRRFAAADGIDTAGLVKTEQQLQAEQAQAQQAMLAQTVTEGALQGGVPTSPQPSGGATGPADQGPAAGPAVSVAA